MDLAVRDSSSSRGAVVADLRAAFSADEAIKLFQSVPVTGEMIRANKWIVVRLHYLAMRYDQAASQLESLMADCTDDRERVTLLRELGDIRQAAHKPSDARQAYEEALKYDRDDWATLNNLAYLLSDQLGDNQQALAYAQRAVVFAATPDTHDTLGWVYVGLGEYAKAIAELNHAIRLDPTQPLPYYHLGEAYRRSGQLTDATNVLTSGQALARSTPNAELLARIDAALTRVSRSDTTP